MTLGLDTSVVLRLLTGLPANQSRKAHERLRSAHQRGEKILVTDIVLAEAYFALQHHYGVAKAAARAALHAMATSGVVEVDPPSAVAVLAPATGARLVDRLVHARHTGAGATTLTFDRAMAALATAERLRG